MVAEEFHEGRRTPGIYQSADRRGATRGEFLAAEFLKEKFKNFGRAFRPFLSNRIKFDPWDFWRKIE